MSRSSDALNAFHDVFDESSGLYYNKLGITDQHLLETVEEELFHRNNITRQPLRAFSLEELQAVHKHLFEDLYDWAGKIRNYPTGRGPAPFALPDMIASSYGQLLTQLQKEHFLIGLEKSAFAARVAYFVNELNAIHPFVEGNGRITRIFLQDLAEQAGHKFALVNIAHKKDAWYKAAAYGFTSADETLFIPLIEGALLPALSENKQELFDAARLLLKEDELPQQDFEALQERMLTELRNFPDGLMVPVAQEFVKTTKIEKRQKKLANGEQQVTENKCVDVDLNDIIRELKSENKR